MTVTEAARKWGLAVGTVRQMVRMGKVEAVLTHDGTARTPYWQIADTHPKPEPYARQPKKEAKP